MLGQRKLLKWTVPGSRTRSTFWGFLRPRAHDHRGATARSFDARLLHPRDRHVGGARVHRGPVRRRSCSSASRSFTVIRLRSNPQRLGRQSRFFGSHTGAAWLVLVHDLPVIVTLLLYRGAQINTGDFPYHDAAAPSPPSGSRSCSPRSGTSANGASRRSFILRQHRRGPRLPRSSCSTASTCTSSWRRSTSRSPGGPTRSARCCRCTPAPTLIDFEDPDEDDVFGRGKIEDFTWKGLLDFATCTECGRCQSQCPAWNTEKPLSPKLLMMDLRDHAFAKAPYLLAPPSEERRARCRSVPITQAEAERPLVGTARGRRRSSTRTCCGRARPAAPASSSARSTSSTSTTSSTCAATRCMIERAFPTEPAGCSGTSRTRATRGACASRPHAWIEEVDFEVRVFGADGEDSSPTTSSGCSGSAAPAPSRTARSGPPRRSPSCCTWPAIEFMVLGRGRDLHRRPGPPVRQRVPLPDARAAERRGAQRGRREEDRRDLPALLQHPRQRVPAARRQLRGRAPHPAAQPAGPRGRLDPVSRRSRRRSPTTTPATSAGTTRSTRRRASCSSRCPA